MSMNSSIKNVVEREIEVKNNVGQVIETEKIKVIQHLYPCRPQVIERQKKWVKFGAARDVPDGQNAQGVCSIVGPVQFINDEGQVNEEIDIAKDLLAMAKQQAMSRNMKK